MPDDRMLHKKLGRSVRICGLSDFEFRVWVQYELSADDCGVMPFAAAPLQADNYYLETRPARTILRALDQLVRVGLLHAFEHQGRPYACQLDWQDFQGVRYPRDSHLPIPPAETLALMTGKTADLFRARLRNRAVPVPQDFGKVSEKFPAPAGAGDRGKRLTANGQRLTAGESSRGDDGFAVFWAAYPRKVSKHAAKQAWRKLRPDEALRAVLVEAVARQAATPKWREKDGEFIPHASTWLNGRRWEDELPAPRAEGPLPAVPSPVRDLCLAAGLKHGDIAEWFTGASLAGSNGRVTLVVPDDDARAWVQRHYADALEQAAVFRGAASLVVAGVAS